MEKENKTHTSEKHSQRHEKGSSHKESHPKSSHQDKEHKSHESHGDKGHESHSQKPHKTHKNHQDKEHKSHESHGDKGHASHSQKPHTAHKSHQDKEHKSHSQKPHTAHKSHQDKEHKSHRGHSDKGHASHSQKPHTAHKSHQDKEHKSHKSHTAKEEHTKSHAPTKSHRAEHPLKRMSDTHPVFWKNLTIILIIILLIVGSFVILYMYKSSKDVAAPKSPKPPMTPEVPKPQPPVAVEHSVIVVEDESCKNCQVDEFISQIRDGDLFPKLSSQKISRNSQKGMDIIEELDVKILPVYLFSKSLEQDSKWSEVQGAFKLVEYRGDQLYMIDSGVLPGGKVLVEEVQLDRGVIIVGNKNAKVKIIEFSDYECPFCAIAEGNEELVTQFRQQAPGFVAPIPQIFEEYVDTGKVQFVYINLPFKGTSRQTHLAALCAHEQGKWIEYNKLVFENFENGKTQDLKTLVSHAREVKLDVVKFEKCVEDKKYDSQIDSDMELASDLGIGGTPGFIIGNQIISGVVSYPEMKEVIDAALEN